MKVTIIGSGTWGTALGQVLVDNGHDVIIYGKVVSQVDDINNNHKNSQYFGDEIILPENLKATTSLKEAVKDCDIILISVPTSAFRTVLTEIKALIGDKKKIIVNTAKGFDTLKHQRISQLIEEVMFENISALVSLIGPSHAEEVIVRDLTCIAAVSEDKNASETIANIFSNNYFRVYTLNDVKGAEIGVAMKNAIALASGILEGLGYGDNARAALCTRGLAEIVKFGMANGGQLKTYLGLTGLGDLVVTCYSFHSRNFKAGLEIGKADSASEFLKNNTATVEGIRTVEVIYQMAKKMNIELPIINSLYNILFKNLKPSDEVLALMNRPLKSE
jgi:glycerol-3-phosphate dehydrogenase (NAD(P)+)